MAVRRDMIKQEGTIRGLDYWELKEKISAIQGSNQVRDRALAAFLFITGCRIEEVVKFCDKEKNWHSPIKKTQIEMHENYFSIMTVRVLKSRKNRWKSIPIVPMDDDEKFFMNTFLVWYHIVKEPNDPLFNMTRQRAFQILSKVGLFPHLLRHSRCTILVTKFGFDSYDLQKFIGWNSIISSEPYVHLNVKDLVRKMSIAQNTKA